MANFLADAGRKKQSYSAHDSVSSPFVLRRDAIGRREYDGANEDNSRALDAQRSSADTGHIMCPARRSVDRSGQTACPNAA